MSWLNADQAVHVLQNAIPDAEWFLRESERHNGWLALPTPFRGIVERLRIETYPLLYEKETSIGTMLLLGFPKGDELHKQLAEIATASEETRGELLIQLSDEFDSMIDGVRIPKTEVEILEAKRQFALMTIEEQAEATRFAQHFFCFFFASFFQNLSVMVHGEKLTSLVSQAKNGNDEAFVKAVQIDRRCLTAIPYFRTRFEQSQGGAEFSRLLAYRLNSPPYRGKIRYKSLWLALAFLDQVGLIDKLTHPELLDICDRSGVGGYANRIEEVKYFSKRLAEFRQFQRRGVLSTP